MKSEPAGTVDAMKGQKVKVVLHASTKVEILGSRGISRQYQIEKVASGLR
jgi:hypothetical protein